MQEWEDADNTITISWPSICIWTFSKDLLVPNYLRLMFGLFCRESHPLLAGVQAVNAAQKSADTQVNNLPVGNPTNTYLTGGYGDPNAIPNDPSKNSAADPATNNQVRGFRV